VTRFQNASDLSIICIARWIRLDAGAAGASARGKNEFRSSCSIARALEIVGDKWTLLIVRDLLWHGKHTFHALQQSAEHIPTNILSDRLKRLVEWGLVRREPYQQRPVRFEYHLTEMGKAMEPVLLQIMAWGHKRLGGGRFDPATGKTWKSGASR
jgi:DNA-binding HxlR family transcriptional regulator